MYIKIRRDTLIILLLAFILIVCGRLIIYVAYASSAEDVQGVPIAGIIVKGNDIVPIDSIRYNVQNSGLREGSYIDGDILKTSIRELPVTEAEANAESFVRQSTIPGTTIAPIAGADVSVNRDTGIVTVTVIEDFSTINIIANSTTATDNNNPQSSTSVYNYSIAG
ncbi:hypothetical protein [uncultured Methanobrevibacter sp.]|uniref:hypothetical protein n=1 Tax=uncultured Methanobrevibacter sp. TaxID=253161 RepID=UPI0025F1AAAA|nr:hypothetical protein [uncultured Methanobrevibacter sp.]